MVNQVGFVEVNEEDVVELLQSHKELSNEELRQLDEQRGTEEEVAEVPDTSCVLTTKRQTKAFKNVELAIVTFDDDSDRERSSQVARMMSDAIESYQQIYKEKGKKATQLSFDIFKPILRPQSLAVTVSIASSGLLPNCCQNELDDTYLYN